ncbi:hypothetical protein ACQCLI_31995 (plasmid) [Pseudomonas nitroreducens]|uniref:hypothetical protein n=1 Tax=Pseudomonas nitroreducens TaxID=46680 RepID=UPI0002DA1B6D|nr:hypothetical protein [Pseudomonas nitroreducens]
MKRRSDFNQTDFLAQPDIEQFVTWLIKTLPTIQAHLKFQRSSFVPQEIDESVQGIEAVTAKYQWKGDWATVSALLKGYRADLRAAVQAGNDLKALEVCSAILDWGNVETSKKVLEELQLKNKLVEHLIVRAALLNPAGKQKLRDLSMNVFYMFNSGLTKVYALLCPDGSPIYDGRVGAAIAMLYHLYRAEGEGVGSTNHRCFAWGPGLEDVKAEHLRHIRNPALLGLGYKGTPQLSYQRPHLWAQRQLILGWIIRAVLQETNWYGGSELDIGERCHAFEAGLFVLGYDLRCLLPNGWRDIPDPKRRASARNQAAAATEPPVLGRC